jgi:hypothetical protein
MPGWYSAPNSRSCLPIRRSSVRSIPPGFFIS